MGARAELFHGTYRPLAAHSESPDSVYLPFKNRIVCTLDSMLQSGPMSEAALVFVGACLLGALHHTAVMCRLLPPGSARGAAALAGLRGAALYYNDCEFLAEEVARALALGRGGRGALHVAVRPAAMDLLNALQELRRRGRARAVRREAEAARRRPPFRRERLGVLARA